MADQPEALRLADAIDPLTRRNLDNLTCAAAAAELRRLAGIEAERDALLEALKALMDDNAHLDEMYWADCCDNARAAIATAEGGGNG